MNRTKIAVSLAVVGFLLVVMPLVERIISILQKAVHLRAEARNGVWALPTLGMINQPAKLLKMVVYPAFRGMNQVRLTANI